MVHAASRTRALKTVSRPKQLRSEETLRRILDSAQQVIEEQGHQELSIAEVARRAGSSVGGFYARFRSKDALLGALEEDFFHGLIERLETLAAPETWEGRSPAEIVRGLIAVLVEVHSRHRRLILAFAARAARSPDFSHPILGFRQLVIQRLGGLAMLFQPKMGHPDPVRATEFAVGAVFGILQSRVVSGLMRETSESLDDDLPRELERLVVSYLGIGDSHGS